MSTPAPEQAPAQEPEDPTEPQQQAEPEEPKDWQAEATRLQEELAKARKWEARAKENHAKVQQYEREKLPEAERAVAEAEQRGRTAAVAQFGKRLARTEFDAAAARRNPDYDTAGPLEYVDLGKFVGEDGEPDTKAITAAVERLIPAPAGGTPSFDGGTRSTPPAPKGMTDIIRKAAGRA